MLRYNRDSQEQEISPIFSFLADYPNPPTFFLPLQNCLSAVHSPCTAGARQCQPQEWPTPFMIPFSFYPPSFFILTFWVQRPSRKVRALNFFCALAYCAAGQGRNIRKVQDLIEHTARKGKKVHPIWQKWLRWHIIEPIVNQKQE